VIYIRAKRLIRLFLPTLILFFPIFILAATSTNFSAKAENTGPTDFSASSSNFKFKAEVGAPGVGKSTSSNFVIKHGNWWIVDATSTGTSSLQFVLKWAIPELRTGPVGTNDGLIFYIGVRNAGSTTTVPSSMQLIAVTSLATSSPDGTYLAPLTISNIGAGTYDFVFKGHQTLTKKLQSITVASGTNELNFSQSNGATSTKGTIELMIGDINGSIPVNTMPTDIAEMGDDKVNGADLSIILSQFNNSDSTGNGNRANLNHDTTVNGGDLSALLKNFGKIGE